MNSNWAEWAIKHKQVIHFFSALIAIMGIFCYAVLGRQEDPSFPLTQMVISAAWPGATAKQMEMHVTDKIEKVVQTVDECYQLFQGGRLRNQRISERERSFGNDPKPLAGRAESCQ